MASLAPADAAEIIDMHLNRIAILSLTRCLGDFRIRQHGKYAHFGNRRPFLSLCLLSIHANNYVAFLPTVVLEKRVWLQES